jgi:NAD(P)-dependent dehydrogenase (short-subunit alcohol dehydrogenase family)
MISIDLSQNAVLITGAMGAIAEHVTRRLNEAGATLILTDILDPGSARQRLDDWKIPPAACHYEPMDVTNSAEVELVVTSLTERFPNIDICLGHAGGCALHPFAATPREEYDRIVQFNFLGQTYVSRALLRSWTRRNIPGHLIFTSSVAGSFPLEGLSAYTPSKAALEAFAKTLALEYAAHGIRCNCIAPGIVAAGSALKIYKEDPSYRALADRLIPAGRLSPPEAVADAFLWLCSPLATEVNGAVIAVDAGMGIPKLS